MACPTQHSILEQFTYNPTSAARRLALDECHSRKRRLDHSNYQIQVLMQVLQLTQDQIAVLPEADRKAIIELVRHVY